MEEVFKSYASFGGGGAQKSSLDGAKFMKMFRDNKLLDKKLTATDIDIIFAKSKPKTERKLTYQQFQEALKSVAKIKYGSDDADGYQKICDGLMKTKGPSVAGTTKASSDPSVQRMTDTSKYTGSHKERFDESGKGRGIEGRKDIPDSSGYVGNYKGQGTYDKTH